MARGWLSGLLSGKEKRVAGPLASIGEALLHREVLKWTGTEAAVVLGVSVALMVISGVGQILTNPEPAVIAASVVLLIYALHLAAKAPPLVRLAAIAWRLRIKPRQFALFLLHRAVMSGMRLVERTTSAELSGASWYVRGGAEIAMRLKSAPLDQVAWRIAEATAPLLWRHVFRAVALTLAPLLLVFAVFRITVTYGLLLDDAAHLDIWDALLYPFAAIADLMLGTNMRAALKSD